MLIVPEVQSDTDNQKHNAGKNRSLDTECHIICEAVCRAACINLEDRVRNDKTTVWQTKKDILGKIPCSMDGTYAPQAVPVINNDRKKNSDQHDIEKGPDRDAGIHQVQQCKKQGIADDGDERIFVAFDQLLI